MQSGGDGKASGSCLRPLRKGERGTPENSSVSPTGRDVTIFWKLCCLSGVQPELTPSPSSRIPLLGFLILLPRSRQCSVEVNSMEMLWLGCLIPADKTCRLSTVAEREQRNLNQMAGEGEACPHEGCLTGLEASPATAPHPRGSSQRTPSGAHTCLGTDWLCGGGMGKGGDHTSRS